jgi:hypothetical protein
MLWAVPLCIILVSFIMLILYFRRGFYFIEHLTLLFHLHSSVFFVCILMIVCETAMPYELDDWVWPCYRNSISGISPILTLKMYYKQNWFKTSIKFIITFAYTILLVFSHLLYFDPFIFNSSFLKNQMSQFSIYFIKTLARFSASEIALWWIPENSKPSFLITFFKPCSCVSFFNLR